MGRRGRIFFRSGEGATTRPKKSCKITKISLFLKSTTEYIYICFAQFQQAWQTREVVDTPFLH